MIVRKQFSLDQLLIAPADQWNAHTLATMPHLAQDMRFSGLLSKKPCESERLLENAYEINRSNAKLLVEMWLEGSS